MNSEVPTVGRFFHGTDDEDVGRDVIDDFD